MEISLQLAASLQHSFRLLLAVFAIFLTPSYWIVQDAMSMQLILDHLNGAPACKRQLLNGMHSALMSVSSLWSMLLPSKRLS